jgi:hypothetical protein
MDLQLKYVVGDDGRRHLTIPDDTRAFVISFVQEHARKPVADIAALVQEGHDKLHAALAGVSEPQAKFKPGPDDWSILELMDHVVTTKQIVGNLCRVLGEGQRPPGFGAEWEEEARQDGVTLTRFASLDEAKKSADAAHAVLLGLIANVDHVNTDTRFKHFVFGELNSREWAVFQRVHDEDHTPHIGKIKATPGFPGT